MKDEKIKKILKARLKREFEKLTIEKRPMPQIYLIGYKTVISDCLWDLFGEVLKFQDE